jgi:hypothetical protein
MWASLVGRTEFNRSRFHDQKGNLAIRSYTDIGDCIFALLTAGIRKSLGWRPAIPWVALPAWRYIKTKLPKDAVVFEWGSGMSTLWYEQNVGEVHAVEDDPVWHRSLSCRLKSAKTYLLKEEAYIKKISDFPDEYFDMIVIDGSQRYRCFLEVGKHLKRSGIMLIDNSDFDRTTYGDLWRIDQDLESRKDSLEIKRFTGWSPGNLFPQETTVVRQLNLPDVNSSYERR